MRRLAAGMAMVIVASCAGTAEAPPGVSHTAQTTAVTATTSPPTTRVPATRPPPVTEIIGTSREGRFLEAVTVGDGGTRIYVVGGIHGDERAAAANAEALAAHLAAEDPDGATVRILIDANPDGTAAGTRDNAAGVDLNRNWPSRDFGATSGSGPRPLSEPETAAVAEDITGFAPALIVALHAAREGPFVDHDGRAAEAAAAFAVGATALGRSWATVSELGWRTPGSLGTYYGEEDRIPVVTVEANRWDEPSAVLPELIAGMDALIAHAVDPGNPPDAPACPHHRIGVTCGPTTEAAHQELHDGTTGGGHGFVIAEAGGRVLAAVNADEPFYPASALKLIHLTTALDWIAGGGDPQTPIPVHADSCRSSGTARQVALVDLLDLMMSISDNDAANAIQVFFGPDALDATMASADMTDTRLAHGFGCGGPSNSPANRTTAIDLARLLADLTVGSRAALWPDASGLMVDVTADAGLTPADGATILAKEGWYGTILTIAGVAVVEGGDRLLVFSAWTSGASAVAPGFGIAQVIGLLVAGVTGGG